MRFKSFLFFILIGFHTLTAQCQTPPTPQSPYNFTEVEDNIRQALAKKEIPSMVVAISKDGKILYERAFGYADIENKVPASVNTAYRLASVSKPVTATGLMVLYEKGRVDLDASAERYAKPLRFQSFVGDPSRVTLRHLLSHTSGLSSYFQYAFGDAGTNAPDFEAAFHRYGVLMQAPGTLTQYSNLGYGLIGFIIAQQSGTSFSSFMKHEVFDPLKMKNSFVERPSDSTIEVAKTYDNDLKRLPDLYNNTAGAGSLYASVHDLMLFGALHLGTGDTSKPLLSRKNIELMRSNVEPSAFNPFFGSSIYYALGWYVEPDDGGYKSVWHEGGMPGASSFLKFIPDERIAVATITNVADKNDLIEQVADQLIKVVLPAFRPKPLNAIADYKPYESQPEYVGKWSGTIYVQQRELPCTLTFATNGEIHISYFDSDDRSKAKEAIFRGMVNGAAFMGGFPGDLPSDDIQREPAPRLALDLIREGDVLSGRIAAYTAGTSKLHHLYPFYIRLRRESAQR
jgi:CubicO group peptidase (beta-lactamase class C family)